MGTDPSERLHLARKHIQKNFVEACKEIHEWRSTGKLKPGVITTAADFLPSFGDSVLRLRLIEDMVTNHAVYYFSKGTITQEELEKSI